MTQSTSPVQLSEIWEMVRECQEKSRQGTYRYDLSAKLTDSDWQRWKIVLSVFQPLDAVRFGIRILHGFSFETAGEERVRTKATVDELFAESLWYAGEPHTHDLHFALRGEMALMAKAVRDDFGFKSDLLRTAIVTAHRVAARMLGREIQKGTEGLPTLEATLSFPYTANVSFH